MVLQFRTAMSPLLALAAGCFVAASCGTATQTPTPAAAPAGPGAPSGPSTAVPSNSQPPAERKTDGPSTAPGPEVKALTAAEIAALRESIKPAETEDPRVAEAVAKARSRAPSTAPAGRKPASDWSLILDMEVRDDMHLVLELNDLDGSGKLRDAELLNSLREWTPYRGHYAATLKAESYLAFRRRRGIQ
jgi:hypothetical protein